MQGISYHILKQVVDVIKSLPNNLLSKTKVCRKHKCKPTSQEDRLNNSKWKHNTKYTVLRASH